MLHCLGHKQIETVVEDLKINKNIVGNIYSCNNSPPIFSTLHFASKDKTKFFLISLAYQPNQVIVSKKYIKRGK